MDTSSAVRSWLDKAAEEGAWVSVMVFRMLASVIHKPENPAIATSSIPSTNRLHLPFHWFLTCCYCSNYHCIGSEPMQSGEILGSVTNPDWDAVIVMNADCRILSNPIGTVPEHMDCRRPGLLMLFLIGLL